MNVITNTAQHQSIFGHLIKADFRHEIKSWLDEGNTITQLPAGLWKRFVYGSRKMLMIQALQTGNKTTQQLLEHWFSDQADLDKAFKAMRDANIPIIKVGDTYSLDPLDDITNPEVKNTFNMSEQDIAELVSRFYLRHDFVELNNFYWTGYECDIFALTHSWRPIELEIKTTRADFFKDAQKAKWKKKKLNIWKHYYIMPQDIYSDDLKARLPHPNSGILTIHQVNGNHYINTKKVATMIEDTHITKAHAQHIMRIINKRYWETKHAT